VNRGGDLLLHLPPAHERKSRIAGNGNGYFACNLGLWLFASGPVWVGIFLTLKSPGIIGIGSWGGRVVFVVCVLFHQEGEKGGDQFLIFFAHLFLLSFLSSLLAFLSSLQRFT